MNWYKKAQINKEAGIQDIPQFIKRYILSSPKTNFITPAINFFTSLLNNIPQEVLKQSPLNNIPQQLQTAAATGDLQNVKATIQTIIKTLQSGNTSIEQPPQPIQSMHHREVLRKEAFNLWQTIKQIPKAFQFVYDQISMAFITARMSIEKLGQKYYKIPGYTSSKPYGAVRGSDVAKAIAPFINMALKFLTQLLGVVEQVDDTIVDAVMKVQNVAAEVPKRSREQEKWQRRRDMLPKSVDPNTNKYKLSPLDFI